MSLLREVVSKDDDKVSKESVKYTNSADRCEACSMFIPIKTAGTCTLVKGVIAPVGWCNEFDRR